MGCFKYIVCVGVWVSLSSTVQAQSRIDQVLVLADRAQVTRVAQGSCEGGKASVEFAPLPLNLDERTLRGEGRGGSEVLGLTTQVVHETEAVDERAKALIAQLQKLRDTMADKGRAKAALAEQKKDLDQYRNVLSRTADEQMRNPRSDPRRWAKTLDTLKQRHVKLDEQRRALDIELRKLRLEESRLQRALNQLGGARQKSFRVTSVAAKCSGGKTSVALSYVVPGATWRPEYDLDFSPNGKGKVGKGKARLTVGAIVTQASGEDWTDVRLMLSTAKPRLGTEAPMPAPIWVDGHEKKQKKVLVQAQERREQLKDGKVGGSGPQSAELNDQGNTFVLTLPHRVTVPADGRPIWSPVDRVEARAEAKLVAVPKLDEHVYQVVALNNPAAYPLLAGQVRSYRSGSYIGNANLAYKGAGEPIEVSLGVDDEIRVERKVLQDRSRDSKFLSNTKHIDQAYRITVRSRARGSETVEIRENIPVSKVKDVKVEIDKKKTAKGYQFDKERGFVTWRVPLRSGQKRDLDLGYIIHLPDDWSVRGR